MQKLAVSMTLSLAIAGVAGAHAEVKIGGKVQQKVQTGTVVTDAIDGEATTCVGVVDSKVLNTNGSETILNGKETSSPNSCDRHPKNHGLKSNHR